MDLVISSRAGPPVAELPVEIVERKGLGHPDNICDALAEELSLVLCRFYVERFGRVLHHNVDKALLRGGAARAVFGGGEVVEPIDIYIAGRAVLDAGGTRIPIDELAVDTVRAWFSRNLRAVDPERHLRVHCLIRAGSVDLAELFTRPQAGGAPLANDTSCGVGFAPLTPLESAVLATERALTAAAFRDRHPATGEDVKVMGVRRGGELRLTVACAAISRHVADMAAYRRFKADVAAEAAAAATAAAGCPVAIEVNTADGETPDSLYLTVTGTSAEAGDDGEVGRGNRCNGLITPYRPMTMEAAAGKNPITHVGKLYSLVAGLAADAARREIPGILAAECLLVSQIGRPISAPEIADVRLDLAPGVALDGVRAPVTAILQRELGRLGTMWRDLMERNLAIDGWPLDRPSEHDRIALRQCDP
jgi:S-adenosylmethionine synthetase